MVSTIVARDLSAGHGVVVARKLRAPTQPELAIGAVTASGSLCLDEELAIAERRQSTLPGRGTGATDRRGASTRDRLRQRRPPFGRRTNRDHCRRRPRDRCHRDRGDPLHPRTGATQVIFAVPVGPPHAIAMLRQEADVVVSLLVDSAVHSVGQYYDDFRQAEDDEVMTLLTVDEG